MSLCPYCRHNDGLHSGPGADGLADDGGLLAPDYRAGHCDQSRLVAGVWVPCACPGWYPGHTAAQLEAATVRARERRELAAAACTECRGGYRCPAHLPPIVPTSPASCSHAWWGVREGETILRCLACGSGGAVLDVADTQTHAISQAGELAAVPFSLTSPASRATRGAQPSLFEEG